MNLQISCLNPRFRFSIHSIVRLIVVLVVAALCANVAANIATAQESDAKKVIICSTTQVADFTRQVVGDRCEVICVLAAGQDPHTYEPGNDDNLAAGRADLCLANGWNLEGDSWMEKLADAAGKPLVNCVDGVKPREMDYHDQVVNDPHAWFDPKNAWIYVKNIRDAAKKLDPEHAAEFEMRADLYRIQLLALNKWISQSVNKIPKNGRILVTHHDAFGYFADTYEFKAMSPVGWTTGEISGVSIEQKQKVVESIRETGVPAIFVETSTNSELLASISRETGAKVGESLYSDAMGPPGSAGETYIGMMRENVLRIVSALQPASPAAQVESK
jgi:manganese/iron transport system substrate-binding protein